MKRSIIIFLTLPLLLSGTVLPAPKDDETLVYPDPGAPLTLSPGDPHPTLEGWKFYASEEFDDEDSADGLPTKFIEHRGGGVSRSARIDNASCSEVKDGVLKMWSVKTAGPVDNRFGKEVDYLTSAYRSPRRGEEGHWCSFTENMRIEVRFRRSDAVGFNNALWFMGDNNRVWPACGEIDLLENPKKQVNQIAHFTIHSEHHFAGIMGGTGSVTATAELSDMTRWNIYWIEWYPDRIVGGVNGEAYFEHRRGEGESEDWPWSDDFFMLITTGISDDPARWPGAVDPSGWDPYSPPSQEVDWVRVYVNDDYRVRSED